MRNADGPSAGPLCPPDLDGMMPITLRDEEEEVLRVEQGGLDAHELLLLRARGARERASAQNERACR